MKIILFLLTLSYSVTLLAEDWRSPNAKFDARKLMTDKSSITWHRVDQVQKTCEFESKKRGFGGFGYQLDACSFWSKNSCEIFTSKSPTLHDVGHEIRHCFQGDYH